MDKVNPDKFTAVAEVLQYFDENYVEYTIQKPNADNGSNAGSNAFKTLMKALKTSVEKNDYAALVNSLPDSLYSLDNYKDYCGTYVANTTTKQWQRQSSSDNRIFKFQFATDKGTVTANLTWSETYDSYLAYRNGNPFHISIPREVNFTLKRGNTDLATLSLKPSINQEESTGTLTAALVTSGYTINVTSTLTKTGATAIIDITQGVSKVIKVTATVLGNNMVQATSEKDFFAKIDSIHLYADILEDKLYLQGGVKAPYTIYMALKSLLSLGAGIGTGTATDLGELFAKNFATSFNQYVSGSGGKGNYTYANFNLQAVNILQGEKMIWTVKPCLVFSDGSIISTDDYLTHENFETIIDSSKAIYTSFKDLFSGLVHNTEEAAQ